MHLRVLWAILQQEPHVPTNPAPAIGHHTQSLTHPIHSLWMKVLYESFITALRTYVYDKQGRLDYIENSNIQLLLAIASSFLGCERFICVFLN